MTAHSVSVWAPAARGWPSRASFVACADAAMWQAALLFLCRSRVVGGVPFPILPFLRTPFVGSYEYPLNAHAKL